MRNAKFGHLIQDVVNKKGMTTEQLGKKLGLSFWTARTLRWGDRMYLSDDLVSKCIRVLGLPSKTAHLLADKQNAFSSKVLKQNERAKKSA